MESSWTEYFSKYRIVERRSVDGLRVVFKDRSWVMFRPSGTEPKTRIYCEARDELRLGELVDAARNLVERLARPAIEFALIRHGDGRDGGGRIQGAFAGLPDRL